MVAPGMGEAFIFFCLFFVAGLTDLVLLPFRPLLPQTFYVGTAVVQAAKVDPTARPIPVGHYLITPPTGRDWYSITPPGLPPQLAPDCPAASSPCPGARLLFIRHPTSFRPVATRGLYRSLSNTQPRLGRIEPAAIVRIAPLDAGQGDLEAQLASLVESIRAAPNGVNVAAIDITGVVRSERSFAEVVGLSCLRDEFAFRYRVNPDPRSKVSRALAHSVVCADPACPGQAVTLVVRASEKETEAVEREAGAFLGGLQIDPAVPPACNPPPARAPRPVKMP